MPIPEERLYAPGKLNRWFAVSSVLMTLSLLWMIAVDFDRPWIQFQDSYFVSKAALAHLEFLDATRQERTNELGEAKQRLADAKQLDEQINHARRETILVDLAEADLEFRKVNPKWSQGIQVMQVTSDTYERILGEFGSDHPKTKQAHEQLETEKNQVAEYQKQKEHFQDRKRELQDELKRLDEGIRGKEKLVRDLEQRVESAQQKDREFRGVLTDDGLLGGLPIVKWVISAPLLDFTAPKTTPSRRQVHQLVLPQIRQQLNYLESYTTDRCTTCHVAIDDPEFSQERLAARLELALPGINEELQRRGKQPYELPVPPTLADAAAPKLPAGQVTEHWKELSSEQRDQYFEALQKFVNRYLAETGRKKIELGQPLLAHPDLDLYVAVDSPHPKKDMGCTVCHEGNSQETDFVLAAHSPPTHKTEEAWKEEYYVTALGVPNITFETVAHYWDRPMLLPQHTQAGCAKCHTNVADIDRFEGRREGEMINQGRHLFRTLGCINCHEVKALAGARKVGPDLTRISAKLTPEFVQQWAFFPQKFRPSTRMPHLFMQENNRAESANSYDTKPVFRTETEVAAISKYLFAVSDDQWKPLPVPEGVKGDPEKGKALFRQVGCIGCHANLSEFGEEWITADLTHRLGIDLEKARYQFKGMTQIDRAKYVMEHFTDDQAVFLNPEKVRFNPEKGHTPSNFTRIAPELSAIGSKVTFEWLYSWLMQPTHYWPETKMPNLRMTSEEAADVASYLMTLRHDSYDPKGFEMSPERRRMVDDLLMTLLTAQRSEKASRAILADQGEELTNMLVSLMQGTMGRERAYEFARSLNLADKKLVFLGNKMVAHYGCYACHTIPGFKETTPPGTELTAWSERPIAQLDFAFYDHAFHHMREEQEETFGHVYPLHAEELNFWAPGENPKEQITHTHAAFAKHKMLNPRIWDRQKIKKPYDKLKMPNFYLSDDEAEALTTYLMSRRSPRVADAVKVDYEAGTAGAIARGRDLTRELNCVGCHEIEDNAPTIQQYFRRSIGGSLVFDALNAPPSLWGEGAKVQHSWLHRFFQHVEPLRPWLTVRMPTFNLSNDDATTLVEYFAALSRQDSNTLAAALSPVSEFIKTTQKTESSGTNGTSPAASAKEPNGPRWFEQDPLRRWTERLRRFAIERKLIRPNEIDPLRTPQDRLATGHEQLLKRTAFLQKLYDVAFPFVEPPKPLSPAPRFETGTKFFGAMGCLSCHVLGEMLPGPAKNTDEFIQIYRLDGVRGEGDKAVALLNGQPYPLGSVIDGHKLISASNVYNSSGDVDTKAVVEGPNAKGETERVVLVAPSAPNLSLTHRRLRREWVVSWMLQPGWIQPGTKMPQNFADGKSPFEGDPDYPGAGMDHVNLLVDFLYDAGTRGTRAPLAKSLAAKASEDFDEDGKPAQEEFKED